MSRLGRLLSCAGLVWALAACTSETSPLGSGDEPDGAAAGAAGSAGTTASAGTGGVGGVDSGSTGGSAGSAAGAAGTADTRVEARTYARDDLSCTQDSDCCVVFDYCVSQGYLVAAIDQAHVAELLKDAPQDKCNLCIPPPIQASCDSGICKAVKISCTGSDMLGDATKNHCGKVTLPAGCTVPQFDLGLDFPGLGLETIIGCGP